MFELVAKTNKLLS